MTPINPAHPDIGLLIESKRAIVDRMVHGLVAKGQQPQRSAILATVNLHLAGDAAAADLFSMATFGPCVVGYNIVKPWWADYSLLIEEFLVRYKDGNITDTFAELKQYAASSGCSKLVVASLASDRPAAYERLLNQQGFREVSQEFVIGVI